MKNGTYSITVKVDKDEKVTNVQATNPQNQELCDYAISALLDNAGLYVGKKIEEESELHLLPPKP